jgi:hypothetical protein
MNASAYLLLSSLLFFTSCSQQSNKAPYALTLDASGIGPISKETPFDPSAISALLPGFETAAFTSVREGEGYPLLRIMRGSEEWMVIHPAADRRHIGSISLRTPHISNSEGVTIGSPLHSTFSEEELRLCRPGEELGGRVICQSKKTEHILYYYNDVKEYSGDTLPPYPVLKTWKVEEIVWKP